MNVSVNKKEKSGRAESALPFRTAPDRVNVREMSMCMFGSGGTCCHTCNMGPCQIIDGVQDLIGVCGATADTVEARNFARMVGAGVSSQIEEARQIVKTFMATARGETPYAIFDEQRLTELAHSFGIDPKGMDKNKVALAVGESVLADFEGRNGELTLLKLAPEERRQIWQTLRVAPRGLDREVVELMHRTHMGVDQEYINIIRQASRCALADSWGASLLATRLGDIMFKREAMPAGSGGNMVKRDQVNIVVFNQSPLPIAALREASADPELNALLQTTKAKGINLVCGSIGRQETLLSTGAVEVMVACGSCVMPSLAGIAQAFHTRIITFGASVQMVEAEDHALTGPEARDNAKIILKMAIENLGKRGDCSIPSPPAREEELQPVDIMRMGEGEKIAGQLKKGAIRGIGMVIGCDNYRHNEAAHLQVAQLLLKNDILVLTSGCAAESLARAGLLRQETLEKVVGPGLREACSELGLPPVLSLGTCLDSSRLLIFAAGLVNEGGLGRDLADLPLAAVAPLWTSEKIVATGQGLVASGITTFFRELPITGSRQMLEYLLDKCRDEYGANWVLEEDPLRLARGVISHIDKKRAALDLQTGGGEKQP